MEKIVSNKIEDFFLDFENSVFKKIKLSEMHKDTFALQKN